MAPEPPSPSASSVLLPFLGGRERRGSLASLTSTKGDINKDVLAQALDDIHTSASKSETLTSFHDYDGGAPKAGAKEIVSSGVTGLYGKLIRGLGGGTPTKEGKGRPQSTASKESIETASIPSLSARKPPGLSLKSPPPDTASSTPSLVPSPVLASFTSNVSQLDAPTNESRSDAQRKLMEQMEGRPKLDTDHSKNTRQRGSDEQENSISEDPPTGIELERARSAIAGIDGSAVASEALARVLTHQEVDITEKTAGRPSLQLGKANESAVDSSDSEQESLRSPAMGSASQVLEVKAAARGDNDEQALKEPQRPPLPRVGASHLPGFDPSRRSSTDGGSLSSAQTRQENRTLEPSANIDGAMQRKRQVSRPPPGPPQSLQHVPSHLKRRVLSKAFWMRDENARDCFYCGQAFSTFRRKHHCRTCGQIFDAQCTTLVPGRPFGQPSAIRLCKPCEAMIYGSDDDSSVFSDDADEIPRSPMVRRSTGAYGDDEVAGRMEGFAEDTHEVATPAIGIPVSRRNREFKRGSAVIEFAAAPTLARPTSSHSLISLARRPRSSSHRRHHSRQQNLRGARINADERVPFHPSSLEERSKPALLPAFHNDNIIDPDIAAFASDEGSDDDDQPSIFAAMADVHSPSPGERERMGVSGFLSSAVKKGRSRLGTVSSVRGMPSEEPRQTPKGHRHRNSSMGSMTLGQPSPRRSRSNILLRTATEADTHERKPITAGPTSKACQTKLVRSSAMQGRDAPPVELNRASLDHARKLMAQLLKDSEVKNAVAWEKALLPILLQCTDDVEPNVQLGDDMDIRHYIKLKKVPGGRAGDTSYFSGVVFSKNIALKSMARSISNPRIAIVTFSIEYARHQSHFMSLEPVIAQEQEYLRNLVARIVALQPHVLLVQKHVSGSALGLLEQAGITVVYNIKESVLAAVARMTQTTMIKSVDKLAIDPSHLGHCDSFEVKTYVHEGMRKSYIYLSGCQPDLGCTIVLRGADTKTLRSIKRITEFMCYVTYNLKLETSLMRDEFVSVPSAKQDHLEPAALTGLRISSQLDHGKTQSHDIATSRSRQDVPSQYEKLEAESKSRILSISPFVVFMQPYMLTQLRDSERRLTAFKTLRDQYAAADEKGDSDEKHIEDDFALVKPEDVHAPASKTQPKAVREYLHAVHEAQLDKTQHTYETQKRLFESFTAGKISPFDPFSHQSIVVLASTVSTIDQAPCSGPELISIGFYAGARHVEPQFEEDCTLGQFVEDMCMAANTPCKDCSKKVYDHHRQYVHGYGQLSISVQRQPAKLRGYHKTIFMWAACRICKAETTVTPMSENTYKYSFAKYLELSFWSSPLHPRAGVCQHDIHRDFLRCFGFQDYVVRMQYDPVDIYDVVVPRSTITWKVESDLSNKNEQYLHFVRRLNAFTESIKKRLDSIHVDTLDEKKAEEAHEYLNDLRIRAGEDHEELLRKLQQKYTSSRYYELIPLNRALRFMDEKALAWDDTFNDFERDYFPSETDIRKLATLQLRNMFLESQPAPSTVTSETSDNEEGTEKAPTRPKLQPHAHTALDLRSDEAHNVLTNTMEEHKDKIGGTEESGGDHDATIEGGLTRKVSPREEQENAVRRNDVKHLDLAVPTTSSHDSSAEGEHNSSEESKQSSRPVTREGDGENFLTQSKVMGSGLLERIEQIRHSRTPSGEHDLLESKIPRLVDLKKRAPSPMPSPPPLMRAKSSPTHVPRMSDHSIDAVAISPPVFEEAPTEKPLRERFDRVPVKVGRATPSLIPRSVPKADDSTSNSVSALAKHFEQMSREFEKERLKERRQRITRSRQNRANPLASSQPVVEVYRNATEAVGGRPAEPLRAEPVAEQQHHASDELPGLPENAPPYQPNSSDETQTDQQQDSTLLTKTLKRVHIKTDSDTEADGYGSEIELPTARSRDVSDPTSGVSSSTLLSPAVAPEMDLHPELSIPEHKKNVWFKYLAEFWSKRSASGWANLEYPLHATEHVFEDSDIIVREDEPSSVIALSLACTDYQAKSQTFRSHSKKHTKHHTHTNSSSSNSYIHIDAQQKAIESSLLSDTGTHMKYSFAHGAVKASCKIFYAEAFDALRRKCGLGDRFVESLSRCLKFDSKGGKTKVLFLKTLDNRFIIKSLQEVELKAFTKFAPDYFAFMSATLFHGVPSVIAKMFGLFQVTIKNPATGMDFSYYLLVMENLFYERNPNRRFDLKGSMRNRKIESTGQPDEVLLDENLVETIYQSPLFVREHARKLLQASVWNDTMFLHKQNVMDYSLMAGFDDERKELIVGIIDCIRTYTWDKKLESWIKDRGKNKPTITSPKDYRNRFRYSIMQYVLQCPNSWHHQAQLAVPKTLKEGQEGTESLEAE